MKYLRDLLFADDAAITAHSAKDLQQLMNRFSKACQNFTLTTSLKNKNTGHGAERVNLSPSIKILEFELEVAHDCIYLGSTISEILSVKSEENSSYHSKPDQDSMVQQEVNGKYQNPDLQSQQFQHTAVQQRVLQFSRTTERKLNSFHMRRKNVYTS